MTGCIAASRNETGYIAGAGNETGCFLRARTETGRVDLKGLKIDYGSLRVIMSRTAGRSHSIKQTND